MFRYCKPSFINLTLLEDHNIPLEKVLDDKAAGMAFPLDAKYFDDFPNIHMDMISDAAGSQYPRPDLNKSIIDLCWAKYGEMYLDCKMFTHLHPWDLEGGTTSAPYQVKMRLFDIRGFYTEDRCYLFFKYDYIRLNASFCQRC